MPAIRLRRVVVLGSALALLGASEAAAFELRVLDAARGRPLAEASVAWRIGDGKSVTLSRIPREGRDFHSERNCWHRAHHREQAGLRAYDDVVGRGQSAGEV
jgi:hypothetical protein